MKYLTFVGLSLLLLTGTSWAQCSDTSKPNGRLQWSEPSTIVSPDHAWVVEVHPVFDADDNHSPVTIRNCGDSTSSPLFTLQRDAELYWSSDSKHVLVVNQPLSGTNELLLFSVPPSSAETDQSAPDALNKTVNEVLVERLGKSKNIQFYLPNLVSWNGASMLLAVGGETNIGKDGPLDTYCYGMRINSSSLHVETVLSEEELKATTGHTCEVSP